MLDQLLSELTDPFALIGANLFIPAERSDLLSELQLQELSESERRVGGGGGGGAVWQIGFEEPSGGSCGPPTKLLERTSRRSRRRRRRQMKVDARAKN